MSGSCPECGEFLGRKRSCECGYGKRDDRIGDYQCAWVSKSSGWRCQRMGTISMSTQGQPPWFCAWHHLALRDPEWAENYEQFVGWREKLERDYPGQYLPAPKVWWAMTGRMVRENMAVAR